MAFLESLRNFLVRPAARKFTVVEPAPITAYRVRPLGTGNLDEVLRLNLRCFAKGENYTKHTFSYLLGQPNSLCFQAVTAEGRMAGFLFTLIGDNGIAHITTVGVAPEHRRRRLAARLLDELDRALIERGIASIVLEVRVRNRPAQRLYESCGYSVTQRIEGYYNDGEDGFLMMKVLPAALPQDA
ncbi:MAG: GNAT family N-acetyltransferase [Pyrinomonadaceae bacterium]